MIKKLFIRTIFFLIYKKIIIIVLINKTLIDKLVSYVLMAITNIIEIA